MPKKLRSTIQTGTGKILKRHKNKVAPEAVDEIQSHVWKTRNADWVKLEGERANEKSADDAPQRQQRRHRRPHRQK